MLEKGTVASEYFGDDIEELAAVSNPATLVNTFDNRWLEFLLMSGRTLQKALLMMIPEGKRQYGGVGGEKAFYEYHSCLIEPWDNFPSRSQTVLASVLFLTEMACARRATTSPTTTNASWHPRSAPCRWIRRG